MATITIDKFSGAIYRPSSHQLPTGVAQAATNAKVIRGSLDDWRSPLTLLAIPAAIKTVFGYETGKYLLWTTDVNVARSLVPGDTDLKIYWTGQAGGPKKSSKTLLNMGVASYLSDTANAYPLGIPQPTFAPNVVTVGNAPTGDTVTRQYVYAWAHGNNIGAKSAVISIVTAPNQQATMDGLDVNPPATFKGKAAADTEWKKWMFAYDAETNQYVLLNKLDANDSNFTDDGTTTGKRYKPTAFNASGLIASFPTAPTATGATDPDKKNPVTRTYVYAFAYRKANKKWYRTDISATATLAGVQDSDQVYVTGLSIVVPHTLAANVTGLRKIVYRQDGGGIYHKVATLAATTTEFIDSTPVKKLKGKINDIPWDGVAGTPPACTLSIWTGASTQTTTETTKVVRQYTYTYVTNWGEEGPPSLPSDQIEILPWSYASITTDDVPTGYPNIIQKRIYRTDINGVYRLVNTIDLGITCSVSGVTVTITGSDQTATFPAGASIYLVDTTNNVKSVPITVTSASFAGGNTSIVLPNIGGMTAANINKISLAFDDHEEDEDLGDPLATMDWFAPPSNLSGLTALPNEVLAGFFGNTLAFCEPGAPYAWPTKYQKTTDWDIVAIGMTSGGLFVATKGSPYICVGTTSSSMALQRIDKNQACVSAESMVDMGDYVIYASPDGLVAAAGMDVELITADSITRDQWQTYNPSSIKGALYETRYIGFYDTGTGTQAGFIFDPADKTFVSLSTYATGVYTDLLNDRLLLAIGTNLTQFDAGAGGSYVWKSGRILLDGTYCPSAGRIDAAAYPVTFSLYADGVQHGPYTISSADPFRLPSGYLAHAFELEISGTNEVKRVTVASQMSEIAAQ